MLLLLREILEISNRITIVLPNKEKSYNRRESLTKNTKSLTRHRKSLTIKLTIRLSNNRITHYFFGTIGERNTTLLTFTISARWAFNSFCISSMKYS